MSVVRKLRQLLSLFLIILVLVTIFPFVVQADDDSDRVTEIKYSVNGGAEQVYKDFIKIGSQAYSATAQNQDVYWVILPSGARITGYSLQWEGSASSTVSILGANTSSTNLSNYTENDYISGPAFGGEGLEDAQWYKKNFIAYLNADAKDTVLNNIPKTNDVKGFAMRINIKDDNNSTFASPVFIIQFENQITGIKYNVNNGEEQVCTSYKKIGLGAYSATAQNQDVYLLSLPVGARITGYDMCWEGSASSTVSILGANTSSTNLSNYTENDYISGPAFSGEGLENTQWYKKNFIAYLNADAKDAVLNSIPKTTDAKGFAMRINIKDDNNSTFASPVFVVLFGDFDISSFDTDKTALLELLQDITEVNYYTKNDRFNGKETSSSGFWSDIQIALTTAMDISQDPSAIQTQVDSIVASLRAQRTKLIPRSQLNATALYEAVQRAQSLNLTPSVYTPSSWDAYTGAKTAAETYLASLFETDAQGNVSASDENKAENQTTADGYADALVAASAALDGFAESRDVENAQMAYDSLKALVNKLFLPSALEADRYTPESWGAFLDARESALAFLAAHGRPENGIGYREAEAYEIAYAAYWDACYKGLAAREAGTAEIHVIDHYSRLGQSPIADLYQGTCSVSIPAGGLSLAQALKQALPNGNNSGNDLSSGMVNGGIGVYVNGIYLFKMPESKSYTASPATHRNAYTYAPVYDNASGQYILEGTDDSIRVNAGDSIVVALMQLPTEVNASGSTGTITASAALPYVQYTEIRQGSEAYAEVIEVKSGEEISLNAIYRLAAPAGYSGGAQPKSGATVFISTACADEAEARAAEADTDTGLVTGADGSFTLQLYSAENSSEAWYVLNVLDLSKYGPLSNGANVLIHVQDPSDLTALKTDLKDKLNALRNAHGDEFYTAAQLEQVRAAYAAGISGIDSAADSGAANAAYAAAEQTIREIQKYNENAVAYHLNALRWALPYLPDLEELQAGKLYEADRPVLDFLFDPENGVYTTQFSDYEKTQLTGSELALMEALAEAYAGGQLAETPAFTVSYVLLDETTGEAWTKPISSSRVAAYLGTEVVWTTGANWWDSRPMWNLASLNQYSPADEAALSANGLSHYDLRVSLIASLSEIPDLAYTITQVEDDLPARYGSKINVPEEGYVANWALDAFPRQNVTITVYLKDKNEGDPADAVVEQLKAEFDSYSRSDYSAENWEKLLEAYHTGEVNIRAAADDDARQTQLAAAVAAMRAIEKLNAASGEPIPGWGAGDAFDAGKQVGTVSLSVENSTFPEGAFYNGGDPLFERPAYPIGENDTMMTVILRALADEGYSWDDGNSGGFGISYIANIRKGDEKMGQFSGEPGSGWMGSLNDYMVNEGFPGFSVANGQLGDGDEVRFMFTQNLGADLGGTWGNSNTTLKSLVTSLGEIVPTFASGTEGGSYDFGLLIPSADASVRLTPTAANKNFMVKTFLNEKVTSNTEGNSFYKRTEYIPVRPGDVIYVGVGENAWPSMNKAGLEARTYSPTWYALHVISAEDGADYVNELIAALPAAKNVSTSNYQTVKEQIDAIDAVIAVLSSSEKARVNTAALEAVREAAANFGAVADLKAEINALPKNITEADREAVEAAKAHYDALTAAQRNLLTVAETNKLQKAVNTLTLMDKLKTVPATKDFDSAAAGSQDTLIAALKAWLGPDGLNIAESSRIMVEVSSFTEATAGGDGSYSATVSFILGDGSAAATQTKDIRGVITRSGETGVTGIKVSGVPATGSGAAWAATLPYGTDLKTLTGEVFEITLKDEKAQVTEGPAASNNGETWSFTVTALDGATAAYTVTLSVSEVAVKVLDSWIYSLSDDAEPVKLDPAAVTGLLEAVSVDALALPAGTEEAFLWLEVREKAGDNVYEIMPVFAADGEESGAVPAAALIGKIGLTLPVPGTEYAKVLFGTEYLDAQGDANGIRFDVAEAGDYTLIPDARIATVTFHLCGGSSGEVTDGETVVYYREDLNKELPIAVKDDSGFAGWNAKEDGSGQVYSAVSAALPADLYAVWQTELPEELKITELTNAAAVTSAVEEDGTAVITVKADVPCVVIMKTGDSYERLKPVRNADGSYSFRQENYDESMEFFVAAKGDYDGDGVFRTVDLAKANMDLVANKAIDPLTILIMGVDSGKLRTVDLAMLNLSIINKDLDW